MMRWWEPSRRNGLDLKAGKLTYCDTMVLALCEKHGPIYWVDIWVFRIIMASVSPILGLKFLLLVHAICFSSFKDRIFSTPKLPVFIFFFLYSPLEIEILLLFFWVPLLCFLNDGWKYWWNWKWYYIENLTTWTLLYFGAWEQKITWQYIPYSYCHSWCIVIQYIGIGLH